MTWQPHVETPLRLESADGRATQATRRHTLLHNDSDTVIRWIGNIESIGPNGEAGRSVESGEIA